MLQADRREYRRIAGHSFDCASASSGDINENLGEPTRLEETNAGGVAMSGVHKVQQLMGSSLRKPRSHSIALSPVEFGTLTADVVEDRPPYRSTFCQLWAKRYKPANDLPVTDLHQPDHTI